jgi:Phycobilisome degradation protein nblA
MSPECFELSMEQQFSMRTIELNTLNLPPEQLRELFVEISRQLLVKDNVIRHLMKNAF